MEWEYVDAHSDAEQGSGSIDIDILDTRFAEGSFTFLGRFGGRPDGYLTVSTPEKKEISTIEIVDGVVNYDRSHKIDADSLQQSKLVHLIEASGYATQRAQMTGGDVEIVPWKAQDWDYELVLDHLMDPTKAFADLGAVRMNQRWIDGSEIDVPIYDLQYFIRENSRWVAIEPENSDFLPTKRYVDGSIAAYSLLDDLLENITFNIMLQSESDKDFLQQAQGSSYSIFVGAWPDGDYAINRFHWVQDGQITAGLALQKTNPVNNSPLMEGGILSDATENLGISTTGQNSVTVDLDAAKLRPFGVKNLLFRYDRPIGFGEYHGVGIPGKDCLVDVVHDYIPN